MSLQEKAEKIRALTEELINDTLEMDPQGSCWHRKDCSNYGKGLDDNECCKTSASGDDGFTGCDDHYDCFIKDGKHFQDRDNLSHDCDDDNFEHSDDCSCYEEYTHNDDINNTCQADSFEHHGSRCSCYDDYHHYDNCNHDDCRDGYFTQEEVDEKLKEKDERIQQLQDEVSKLLGGVGA